MITLDGAYGEGGGALVRTALALSTLTGQEFNVTNIRAGREHGGLKAQHLQSITALKQICKAQTNEVEIGSTELWFKPGNIKSGRYEFDIGTAGSITLFLQAIILPCLFAPAKVTITVKGGTCGKWQASVDYLQNLLLPQLHRFVDKIELKIVKRGYYPKGGGIVQLEISPRFKLKDAEDFVSWYEEAQGKIAKIKLVEQGKLEQIRGIINASVQLQDKEVAQRIKNAAQNSLKKYGVPLSIREEYTIAESIGGELILWGIYSNQGRVDFDNPIILGGDALIELGKSSEEVGKEAAQELRAEMESDAAVDYHIADQLIPFMALLPGSLIRARQVSNHTLTNIYVAEQFVPVGFKVEGNVVKVEPN